MSVWRLIAHHEDAEGAIEEMKPRSRIAIGWSRVGDLSKAGVSGPPDITVLISKAHHPIENSHLGGPSLWNLYHHMQIGDLVILNANGKRVCVFEVVGPYIYEADSGQIMGYAHQRPACLTSINPEDLWNSSGSAVAEGQNIRWTLAKCSESTKAKPAIYKEGSRFSVISTAIERNPLARAACIEYYGCKCNVCSFDFGKVFGELGKGYIHVHHHVEVSSRAAEYNVNPIEDLIPLCPNCHAMAHQQRPPVPVEKLKEIHQQAMSNNSYMDSPRK
ncbi:HNH endonuclease [Azotobacter beijerinckii]|uniref:HNH endonuclease n=2 Tax=Azotobacter beijerinckii TaxID=170623 RepID=A0A1I0VQI9_9GAMM|nr:HNH endonuclease [Azotobacter beijerinckii]